MKKIALLLFSAVFLLSTGCKTAPKQSTIENKAVFSADKQNSAEEKKNSAEKMVSAIENKTDTTKATISNPGSQAKMLKEEVKQITITSVGDIMMHQSQINAGSLGNGKYDYSKMFKSIKPYIEKADFSLGNLEVTLSGGEKGYTGYPMFNAPEILAKNVKAAGFDLVTTANNHSLDRRFYGVKKTIENLDKVGLLHTGTYKTFKDSEQILVKDIKGINIAFLAYTYGTNGISIPEKFAVNRINKDKILKDIKKAKALKADMIITSMHFGVEYKITQNKTQEDLADFLFKNGVDIVLGSHPHVLQPMEVKKVNVDGKKKDVFVIYSQGNIVANMPSRYKNSGVIINLSIRKDSTGTKLNKVDYIPTWVDSKSYVKGNKTFEILPIFSAKHYSTHRQYKTIKQSFNDSIAIMDSAGPAVSVFKPEK
jgi:poly-gamma-glutamate capsule biosynthesis protein CapA/YwtB (metallophosphatase superfamily)